MSTPAKSAAPMRFGTFEVDLVAGELRKSDRKVRIQEQPFRILLLLLERPGEIVSREYLVQRLWPDGTFVDYEHSVNTAIRKLREALGDDPDSPRFVETVPRRGYRFIAPLNNEPVDRSIPPSRTGQSKWIFAAALLTLAAALATYFYFARAPGRLEQPVTVVPLTSLPGQEISPTFSPDGTQIAFGWDGENHGAGFDVYVKAVGAEKPLRITHHPAAELGTAWSPDGRYIAISRDAGEYSGIFLVPPTGGPERKLASGNIPQDFGTYLSWSPDSKRVAFVESVAESGRADSLQMLTMEIDSPNEPKALRTDCPGATEPAFSPGGDVLAFVCIEDFGHFGIRLLNPADGKTRTLLSAPGFIFGLAWSADGQRILYSRQDEGGISELWQFDVAHPQQRQKLGFGSDGLTPTINFTASRLAYAQQSWTVNIWRVGLGTNGKSAGPLITSTRQQGLPDISPDGRKIAFASDRSGHNEIWECDADGTNAVQLTFLRSLSGTPRWSPRGNEVLFDSRYEGSPHLYLVDANGGVPRRLETGTLDNSRGSWSSDGRFIYFERDSATSAPSIWRVPVKGGTAVEVAKPPSSAPIESPDGQYLYFVRNVLGQEHLWQVRPDGSGERLIDRMPPLRFYDEWYPVVGGVYFMLNDGRKQTIEFYDLRTQEIHQVYVLEKPPGMGLSVSPDRTWLLYSQVDESASDLMLVENFR